MTLARFQIRDAARTALQTAFAATPGLTSVKVPNAWDSSIPTDDLPIVLVGLPRETKVSRAGRSWTFDNTVSLAVLGRLPANGPADLEGRLDVLANAIEQTLITSAPLNLLIKQWTQIDTEVRYSSESSTHIAEIHIVFTLTTIEQFAATGTPLTEIDLTVGNTPAKVLIPQQ